MCHANNEKWKQHRTTKPKKKKNQNAQRNGNLQILGNIRSRRYQTCGDKIKNKKRTPQGNEKTTQNQTK